MVTRLKFENAYPTLDDKIAFLSKFDLLNLQKAGKIGKISFKKMEKKKQAIKSILSFDIRHKFLICKTIYANQDEYLKSKIDDNKVFKTMEWNKYQFDNMTTKDWEMVKDELTNELKVFKNEVKNNENVSKKNTIIDTEKEDDNQKEDDITKVIDLDTDTNIKFDTENIKTVSFVSNPISSRKKVKTKVVKPIINTSRISKNNVYKEAIEQSNKVRNLIKKFDERKKQIQEEKNRMFVQLEYEQKIKELEKDRQFQRRLLDEQRILKSKQVNKIANTIRLTINRSAHDRNYQCKNQKDSFVNYFSSPNNMISKNKAKHEIDKLNYIDGFEYREDANNKKILIIKGR